MKLKIILFTLLTTFFMTFATLTQASVNLETFSGTFKVGPNCPLSKSETATITLDNNTIDIRFVNDANKAPTEIFLTDVDEDYGMTQVTLESHSISNTFFAKLNEGMNLPIAKRKLAHSATGNRVRLTSIYYETNMTYECVFYRL